MHTGWLCAWEMQHVHMWIYFCKPLWLCFFASLCSVSQTSHCLLAQIRPQNRCIPRLCGETRWWPHHCPPALVLPAAPAVLELFSAEYLCAHEVVKVTKANQKKPIINLLQHIQFIPILIAASRSLRASFTGWASLGTEGRLGVMDWVALGGGGGATGGAGAAIGPGGVGGG